MHFLIGLIVVLWVFSKIGSCSQSADLQSEKGKERQEFLERSRAAEESIRKAREEGARALEQADDAIRQANQRQRSELESRAISHRMSNRNGVRVDQYTMADGTVVTCTTTIRGSSPAMFNCD